MPALSRRPLITRHHSIHGPRSHSSTYPSSSASRTTHTVRSFIVHPCQLRYCKREASQSTLHSKQRPGLRLQREERGRSDRVTCVHSHIARPSTTPSASFLLLLRLGPHRPIFITLALQPPAARIRPTVPLASDSGAKAATSSRIAHLQLPHLRYLDQNVEKRESYNHHSNPARTFTTHADLTYVGLTPTGIQGRAVRIGARRRSFARRVDFVGRPLLPDPWRLGRQEGRLARAHSQVRQAQPGQEA